MIGCLRAWGPATMLGLVIVGGLSLQIWSVVRCQASGGTWVGGIAWSAYCLEGDAP